MRKRIAALEAELKSALGKYAVAKVENKRLREITEDQLRTITALTEGVTEATGKEGSSAIILYIARLETENTRLRDELTELEGDFNIMRLQRDAKYASQAPVDYALKAENTRLRDALDRYGAHDFECPYLNLTPHLQPCNCGYSKALEVENEIQD